MFSSVRGKAAVLGSVFHEEGLQSFTDRYKESRRASLQFRIACQLFELAVPVSHFAREALRYERVASVVGQPAASREMLEAWGIHVKFQIEPAVEEVLHHQAFVSFGNHSSGIEGVILRGLLERPDCYRVVGDFFPQIGRHVAMNTISVHRVRAGTEGTSILAKFISSLEEAVWQPMDASSAIAANRQALQRAVDLVAREGAGINIFPTGSPVVARTWRNGIGSVVKKLLNYPGITRDVYLVPMFYDFGLMGLIASGLYPAHHPLRMASRMTERLARKPVVCAKVALPLYELDVTPDAPIPEVTAALQALWQKAKA